MQSKAFLVDSMESLSQRQVNVFANQSLIFVKHFLSKCGRLCNVEQVAKLDNVFGRLLQQQKLFSSGGLFSSEKLQRNFLRAVEAVIMNSYIKNEESLIIADFQLFASSLERNSESFFSVGQQILNQIHEINAKAQTIHFNKKPSMFDNAISISQYLELRRRNMVELNDSDIANGMV